MVDLLRTPRSKLRGLRFKLSLMPPLVKIFFFS